MDWQRLKKLPINGFKWVKQKKLSKFNEDYIKKYDENNNTEYFLKDVDYPKNLFNSHKGKSFLPKRKKVEKFGKLICSIEDKEKCYSHKSFKTSIKSWLKTKVHRVIHFKQKVWLKPYIDINIKLRINAKSEFEKKLFKLMNNSVFRKPCKM